MIESVDFWPRLQAEDYSFSQRHAVISLTDPGQDRARIHGAGECLRLGFYDLADAIPGSKYSPETLFTAEKARELIAFVEQLQAQPGSREVIVHCEAGVRRSAAVALFVATFTNCTFQNRKKASEANQRVVSVLSDMTGLAIAIPEARRSEAGLYLF